MLKNSCKLRADEGGGPLLQGPVGRVVARHGRAGGPGNRYASPGGRRLRVRLHGLFCPAQTGPGGHGRDSVTISVSRFSRYPAA